MVIIIKINSNSKYLHFYYRLIFDWHIQVVHKVRYIFDWEQYIDKYLILFLVGMQSEYESKTWGLYVIIIMTMYRWRCLGQNLYIHLSIPNTGLPRFYKNMRFKKDLQYLISFVSEFDVLDKLRVLSKSNTLTMIEYKTRINCFLPCLDWLLKLKFIFLLWIYC